MVLIGNDAHDGLSKEDSKATRGEDGVPFGVAAVFTNSTTPDSSEGGTRTHRTLLGITIINRLLMSGCERQDLNLRLLAYEASVLPG